MVLTPQGQYGQYAPQARVDDGYIYPADGSSDGARYPAPRTSRRVYDAQAYPQQRPYYDNQGYAQPPATRRGRTTSPAGYSTDVEAARSRFKCVV